jgi:hypothetical protein
MITIVYRVIVALVALLVADALFRERDLGLKANAALVLVPLILRALMIA